MAAALAGVGGGNFASSVANISFFPEREKGLALGLNAAGGNLGVGAVQLLTPLLVGAPLAAGAVAAAAAGGLELARAGLFWVPPILLAAVCAWRFMDNLAVTRSGLREQLAVARQRHTWVVAWLYFGTFGSFIGYSAGLPLLIGAEFPGVRLWWVAAAGPVVGSLARPLGGWLSDRFSPTWIKVVVYAVMALAAAGLTALQGASFGLFLLLFEVIFVAAGVGNGSTFKLVRSLWRPRRCAAAPGSRPWRGSGRW